MVLKKSFNTFATHDFLKIFSYANNTWQVSAGIKICFTHTLSRQKPLLWDFCFNGSLPLEIYRSD